MTFRHLLDQKIKIFTNLFFCHCYTFENSKLNGYIKTEDRKREKERAREKDRNKKKKNWPFKRKICCGLKLKWFLVLFFRNWLLLFYFMGGSLFSCQITSFQLISYFFVVHVCVEKLCDGHFSIFIGHRDGM